MGERLKNTLDTLTRTSQDLGFDFYHAIRIGKSDINICLSPCSLQMTLCMSLLGARQNTAQQIRGFLHLQEDVDMVHEAVQELLQKTADIGSVLVCNSIFFKKGLNIDELFRLAMTSKYRATVQTVDYLEDTEAATECINGWIRAATKGKIAFITDRVNPLSEMYLINAIYFKSLWKTTFNPKDTTRDKFYTDDTKFVDVKMIEQEKVFKFAFHEESDSQVLELEYADESTTMLLLLPRAVQGLERLENSLNTILLTEVRSRLCPENVLVKIPSFRIEESYRLDAHLKVFGVTDLFEPGRANLEGMCKDNSLCLTSALQKTYIEVNEEGTEAAAVTGFVTDGKANTTLSFCANHPFVFMIITNGSLLFLGRVVRPDQS